MEDYEKIFEAYQQVNEASFNFGVGGGTAGYGYGNEKQPKKQLARFKNAKPDYKNSTAINTASLPGGTRQVNLGGMGRGAPAGAPSESEETGVKSFRKIDKQEVHGMYNKMMGQIHELYKNKNYTQLQSKLEFMAMLSKHL